VDKEQIQLNEYAKASPEALKTIKAYDKHKNYQEYPPYILEHDAAHFEIRRGEVLSFSSLLDGLLVASANDTANVIADVIGPTIPVFMDKVNKYLKEMGLHSTHFVNPHGLHYPTHKTTARDLGKMSIKALEKKEIVQRALLTKVSRDISGKKEKYFYQTNKLLRNGKYYYPYAIGLKTGYHKKAGFCLVAAAEKNGRKLIAVVLGAEKSEDRFLDAKALFEEAFKEVKQSKILFKKDKLFQAKIEGAKTLLKASCLEDCHISFYPSELVPKKIQIRFKELSLPVLEGDQVGRVLILDQKGEVIKKLPLIAQEDVKPTLFHSIKAFFSRD
ncbi:MAG TPA: serine hydrolase, partial [Chlamydiales bacterium]|nr:serine hydrolase [Chlamydiales bacterium]